MPDISTPALPVTKAPSVRATKFQTPQANGFMGEQYPAFQHHFLDIAKAQAEAEIQPNAVGNDLGGETLSPVARRGGGIHRPIAIGVAEVDNAVADAKVDLE